MNAFKLEEFKYLIVAFPSMSRDARRQPAQKATNILWLFFPMKISRSMVANMTGNTSIESVTSSSKTPCRRLSEYIRLMK
jgi:hypothetical protein